MQSGIKQNKNKDTHTTTRDPPIIEIKSRTTSQNNQSFIHLHPFPPPPHHMIPTPPATSPHTPHPPPTLLTYLLPPRYPIDNVSVHPFSFFFCALNLSSSFASIPGSPLSALFTPSLLVMSPTPPNNPPLDSCPPTPSANPPWTACTFLSPVRSVLSFSVFGKGARVSLKGEGGMGEKGGRGKGYLWRCSWSCSRPSSRGPCLRSRACIPCRRRCTSSWPTPSCLRLLFVCCWLLVALLFLEIREREGKVG